VTFTPADTVDYTGAAASVSIDVAKGNQNIAWAAPADITYGTALSSTQLDASITGSGSSATGAATYTPYSDNVTLSGSVTPASLGGRTPSGAVQFSIDGVAVGSGSLAGTAATTLQYLLNRAPGNYTVTAAFTSSDPNFNDATAAASTLVVTPEDARATYDGATFTTTAATIYVPLHATIQDEPVTAGDTTPG
jgi:Bacterial Ig-like domain (group 3)